MFKTVGIGYSFLVLILFSVSFLLIIIISSSSTILAFPKSNVTSIIEFAAFSPATATWYGNPTGAGTVGGACGYAADVEKPPFSAMVSAGNENLFKKGKGCGACYEVKCTENTACSGNPVTITITDECPGTCISSVDSNVMHFDMSGTSFGAIAKTGQADLLRNAGIIPIQYKRVKCNYHNTGVVFTMDAGANPYYFAFMIEYVNRDEDMSSVEVQIYGEWLVMVRLWGANWKKEMPNGSKGPFSIRLILESNKSLVAENVIPADWEPR